MAAKERIYDAVRTALELEGWTITHNSYMLDWDVHRLAVDLGAERLVAAQRQDEVIAVEVKSFLGNPSMVDFYQAIGQ